MLGLVNEARAEAGVPPVELGDNAAAQVHAEAMLEGCFRSHSGLDGLMPHMRYTLAGGLQFSGENVLGTNYCTTEEEGYEPIRFVRRLIEDSIQGWLDSPGHRRLMLDPHFRTVNVGLAWNSYNYAAVKQFETGYLEYSHVPELLGDGTLSAAGRVKGGMGLEAPGDLLVEVDYAPPPASFTRGQLARTYGTGRGQPIALLVAPQLAAFNANEIVIEQPGRCVGPQDVPADAPPPRSLAEETALYEDARRACQAASAKTVPIVIPLMPAQQWEVGQGSFAVSADLSGVLERHGPGVYTVVLFGRGPDGEHTPISTYSIFHGVTPPDTYSPED